MKVLITGAAGLVGRAAVQEGARHGQQVVGLAHSALDIADAANVKRSLLSERPDVIINCAAWTDVDGCERDMDRARKANAEGPEQLAFAAREIDALLVTLSTDYVFDGEKAGFYTQRDQPNPQSVYARSKLDGERRAQNAWARTIVVRSGYIFGAGGSNFVSTVLRRTRNGEKLQAINDMFGTPTYAVHLARQLYRLIEMDLPGIFHVVNAGEGATFESFARSLLKIADLDQSLIEAVSFSDLRRPAPRPRNSRLRCLLSAALNLEPMPPLEEALEEFVASQFSPASAGTAARTL